MPPGTDDPGAESAVEAEPVFPPEAAESTQNMNAVAGDATQAVPPVNDAFGGRPMFRDETPGSANERTTTAEIDLSELSEPDSSGPSKRTKMLLLAGGFLALLLIAGGGAFLLAANGSDEGGDVAGSGALEPGDVFPESAEIAGETYELAITDDTEKCGTAAHGDYGDALDDNNCEQIIRASYVNEDKTRAVTVGVAAMDSAEDAKKAQEAQDLENAEWFAGLSGKEGSGTERMEIAGGHGSGAQWERYLVFALASNTDGRTAEGNMDELTEIGDEFAEVPYEPLGVS
ncbi:hypothetical protein F4561_000215 [Lipingzhangella halophila]|uniref:Uncharacterized protein n=1 Tax=Lipingzhangella halophila TaxID=1783352 RepID=A0A7W7RCC0_9ACTN|nr:hypothetical protein [Lipingzhangella halophila]MBB4929395.1 hypothetical protein [Lipingzhangella halophila]